MAVRFKSLDGQLAGWLEELSRIDMVTSHHKEYLHADAVTQSTCAWTCFVEVGRKWRSLLLLLYSLSMNLPWLCLLTLSHRRRVVVPAHRAFPDPVLVVQLDWLARKWIWLWTMILISDNHRHLLEGIWNCNGYGQRQRLWTICFMLTKLSARTTAFICEDLFYCEQELWSFAFVCI